MDATISQLTRGQSTPDEAYNGFLVILKVYGNAIHMGSYGELQSVNNKLHSYRIHCRELDSQSSNQVKSSVKVFVLDDSATSTDRCKFQYQDSIGHQISSTDLAIFTTSPIVGSSKASYAIDIGVSMHKSSMEDLKEDQCKKIGTAYLYLDTKFSTQGIQRMQVISTKSLVPVGQMQIEYLVVKNPLAYGISVPRPKWLSQLAQLDAGHRGAGSGCRADLPGSIQENTVASFNYAARHGADMCELDVMCTADGVPVVYHNYVLDTSKPGATQIDQLTLDELRGIKSAGVHDKDCKHTFENTINSNLANHTGSGLFPTLEEVLQDVDKSCALNIELKWPQLLTNGKCEAIQFREINDFVDRILKCIFEHSNGRNIVLSTLSADIALMLRLKQSHYPVLFLTTGDSQRFNDPTTKTIKNAIHFAQAFDMAGINPNAAKLTEYLVRYAQDRGLLVYAWGKIETAQTIKELKRTGLNGVIYDRIDLIKPHD